MASYAERRRRALLGIGAVGAAIGFGVAWNGELRDAVAAGEPATTPVATSPGLTTPPSLEGHADAGELVISGVSGTTASASLLQRARDGEIAGVILMGRSIVSTAQVRKLTSSLQAAAKDGDQLPLLIMVDQEGGTVKRFATARPSRSARSMAGLGVAGVQAQGLGTGKDLLSRGVNVDLAPVADVPTSASNFLGTRTFGSTPSAVARNACAFAGGLADAGVVPTLKHFPGLGGAGRTNTDDGKVTIRLSRAQLELSWAPYRQCGAALTMLSNAAYPAISGDATPAVLSKATYDAARSVGASGPFITDALEARALAGRARVAPRAVEAGANLVLHTDENASALTRRQLRAHVSQLVIDARAAKVRELRAGLGATG